ncbi:MAG TPA: bifunctional diaminohydroxyphosphoribosylaminopyrimidine deaminase/5-amino-6-(5-phosphoribosylamino)uracil reductase RibD [Opitutaceae bacterium]|jgi:diaminohydroxyphosphoribosylaminopyrimidine deaminase/5-amino-6-(5-phosphoribosylamino)uracil reductase|nr:bifunctional diaminohydroxyphosphoribosylaminopyrimidine deaminase/5-amino-6-(5-phosphoribosylamino)uracil reductase RibD [Opitutaceae bacterium]
MNATEQDIAHMRQALAAARRAWGETHPNAMVGSVLVEDGRVVAEGYCARDGAPHAERVALNSLGRPPKPGAVLYVTLEPCSTAGRTGACTEAILAAGLKKVVAGATDPNPAHAGRGFEILRQGGVEVVTGVLERECADLNLIFNHWIVRGAPFLAAKSATTLDGRIATRTGESRWITGEPARADVHRWRRLFPAIAVGAGTVMKDNPRLTARPAGGPEWCPLRFVFDGRLRTVADRALPALYTDEFKERTIVVTTEHGGLGYVRKLRALGVQVWVCASPTQRVGWADFRRRCAEAGIPGVMFEGGAELLSQLLQERALDYLFVYRAPVLFADDKAKPAFGGLRTDRLAAGLRLLDLRHEQLGEDTLTRGRVAYPEKMTVDETAYSLG